MLPLTNCSFHFSQTLNFYRAYCQTRRFQNQRMIVSEVAMVTWLYHLHNHDTRWLHCNNSINYYVLAIQITYHISKVNFEHHYIWTVLEHYISAFHEDLFSWNYSHLRKKNGMSSGDFSNFTLISSFRKTMEWFQTWIKLRLVKRHTTITSSVNNPSRCQSNIMHLGMFSLRYKHTSFVALGQFVSSSSSTFRSCVRPHSPWPDISEQPENNGEY